jgi:integrase
MIEQTRRGIDRLHGDFGKTCDPLFGGVYPEEAEPKPPTASQVTLRKLVDRFLDDPTRKAGAKADNDYRVVLRFLGEFVSPNSPLSRVKRDHCRKVVELLTRMPANASKKRGLRDLKPQEAAAEAERLDLAPMTPTTANSYIGKMSALFRWAVREGLIERNPAEKLLLPEETHKSDARQPFSTDQLKAILSADLFQEPGGKWDHHQWIFLIALFSGLRLNEVCTLCCDDVTGREGVDLILVRPDEEGRKRLKSRAARRMVPVHPTLKKLGLLVFVERQRAAGHKVLFPKLKVDRRGYYSDGYQKWFARLLKKAGATAPRTTFHSTRHNFRDQLREIGAPRDVTLALGGWAGNGGTADDYGGGLKPKTLLRWVRKIEYPDLVLPPVKASST